MRPLFLFLFCIFQTLFCYAQDFDWAEAGNYIITARTVDQNGNIYACGSFTGNADFNPQAGLANRYLLTSAGSTDIFIQKLDKDGNFIWALSLGNTGSDAANDIKVDDLGDLYITGGFSGTVDFDPDTAAVQNKTALMSIPDKFLLKLDSAGNFQWVRSNTGPTNIAKAGNKLAIDNNNDVYYCTKSTPSTVLKYNSSGTLLWDFSSSANIWKINIDNNNNLLIAGSFSNLVWIKSASNTGVFRLVSNGSFDYYLAKYSASGNPLWAFNLGTSSSENEMLDFTIDKHNYIYLGGGGRSQMDFDPSANTYTVPHAGGNFDAFISKYSPGGSLVWAKSFGGPSIDAIHEIETDGLGSLLVAGIFDATADFDPSFRTTTKTSTYFTDMFWARYDSLGDFQAVHSFNSPAFTADKITSFFVDEHNSIHVNYEISGTLDVSIDSNNPQVRGNVFGGTQSVFAKYTADSCSYFTLYVDSLKNLSCTDSGYARLFAKFGERPYTYSWSPTSPIQDSVLTVDTVGLYTLTATDAKQCTVQKTLLIDGPTTKAGVDLNTHLVASNVRSGFPLTLWTDVFNDGCQPATGLYELEYSRLLNFISATPAPDSIKGKKLYWTFDSLQFNQKNGNPQLEFVVDTFAQIGDLVCLKSTISPQLNDVDTTNNQKEFCFSVVNSYDPNDKQVFPLGSCEPKFVRKDKPLTYTVRFQNTGNASALKVSITDSLDPMLDINSVRVVSKSHDNLITEVLNQNVLRFTFRNINLIDSATNEAASQGYLTFEVLPISTAPSNYVLKNRANIYFDFNLPITTNFTENTLVSVVPSNFSDTLTVSACGGYSWNDSVYDNSGVYSVYYASAAKCDSILSINLEVLPMPDTSVNALNNTLRVADTSMQYTWIDCNTLLPIPNENSHTFNPKKDGRYAVIITQGSCSDTSKCFEIEGIGLRENFENHFSIAPNPGPGTFRVSNNLPTGGVLEYKVYDNLGRLLQETKSARTEHTITVENASGVYFLVVSGKQNQALFRLIKL